MNITRARNYHLYSHNGRILDLALDGGRCLLGHNPKGLGKNYKNSISRGLYVALPNSMHSKIVQRIKSMFPDYKVLIFPSRHEAIQFLYEQTRVRISEQDFYYFNYAWEYEIENTKGIIELWRPFSNGENLLLERESADIIIPIFPQPGYCSPQVLLYRENSGLRPRNIPVTSHIYLCGLHHILILLQTAIQYKTLGSVAKLKHQPRRHKNSLGISRHYFSEEQWARLVPKSLQSITRTGPYLFIKKEYKFLSENWYTIMREFPNLNLPLKAEYVHVLPASASYLEQKLLLSYFSKLENYCMKGVKGNE